MAAVVDRVDGCVGSMVADAVSLIQSIPLPDQNNPLLGLPIVAIETILSFLSYDEISLLRSVRTKTSPPDRDPSGLLLKLSSSGSCARACVCARACSHYDILYESGSSVRALENRSRVRGLDVIQLAVRPAWKMVHKVKPQLSLDPWKVRGHSFISQPGSPGNACDSIVTSTNRRAFLAVELL